MRQLKITTSITNREELSLEKYLREISKVELVSADEEIQLAERIRKGDKAALDKLTRANLRFVVSVAKQYQGQGLSLPDLINEGNVGLIKAAQRFDDTRGFKFISFAVWWIRQTILQALAEQARMIRLPMNKVALNNRINRAHSMLEQRFERPPSSEEIAEELEIDVHEIKDSISHSARHLSLDTPLSDEEDGSLMDTLANNNADKSDEALYHTDSLKQEIARAFMVLTPRQKDTICYLFGIGVDHPLSVEDIAIKYDVTVERIRQIREKALEKLRSTKNFEMLRGFLAY
ncbi:MAG TPA: RNA polymerase sigma factor RpoD/SigA [Chitinophagaceae bacterium]